jgi:hypothetical protein
MQINECNTTHRLRDKNRFQKIIIDSEKSFDRITHPFMIKALKRPSMVVNIYNPSYLGGKFRRLQV